MIPVLVCGAAGRMGKEVVKAISQEKEMRVAGALDRQSMGEDAGTVAGIQKLNVSIEASLEKIIQSHPPKVMVDFTTHDPQLTNIKTCLSHQVACVIGTTGFSSDDIIKIEGWCQEHKTPALIAPNFAIGAVLLMRFAKEAARYFSWGEIVELHHEKKVDAPSGTALRTAELMLQGRPVFEKNEAEEKLTGSRGGSMNGIRIHSVRLPGLVAHQEVLFGGLGQTLSIRHDSLTRESFMPGVVLAVKKIGSMQNKLYVGLEHFMS